MFDGCQNSKRLRACFELTLAPSFPGAPSVPFAPLSPCGREIAQLYACGVTEAIMLYDAMTLQQLPKSSVTHPVSLGSWDATSSSLSGHTLQTRGPLSSWSTWWSNGSLVFKKREERRKRCQSSNVIMHHVHVHLDYGTKGWVKWTAPR